MANTTVGGITLEGDGNCFIEENNARKEGMLTPMPLYMLDSDETDVFDFGGVIKTINFTGVYVGTSIANVKTFIDSVEALIQGQQDTANGYPLTLTDDTRGTIKVKVSDCDTTKQAGEPLICRWTLKFFQASENA